jgi:hypothetical protein
MTVKELRARADELGLTVKARAVKAELEAAVAAEEARLAAVAEAIGESVDETASEAAASEVPAEVQEPAQDTTGAITIDDIPAGGKVGTPPAPAKEEDES